MSPQFQQLVTILTDLVERKYYGTLTLQIREGKFTLLKKEETLLLGQDAKPMKRTHGNEHRTPNN